MQGKEDAGASGRGGGDQRARPNSHQGGSHRHRRGSPGGTIRGGPSLPTHLARRGGRGPESACLAPAGAGRRVAGEAAEGGWGAEEAGRAVSAQPRIALPTPEVGNSRSHPKPSARNGETASQGRSQQLKAAQDQRPAWKPLLQSGELPTGLGAGCQAQGVLGFSRRAHWKCSSSESAARTGSSQLPNRQLSKQALL